VKGFGMDYIVLAVSIIALGFSLFLFVNVVVDNKKIIREFEKRHNERIKYADDRYVEQINEIRLMLGLPTQSRDGALEWKYGKVSK
jgi:hypothetical protein